jgi:23S rRNA (cytosine1962-C5)-methyltransferase
MSQINKVYSEFPSNYELIDAGAGKKLERFGEIIVIRPEVQAYFKPEKNYLDWKKLSDAEFIEQDKTKGKWVFYKENVPKNWQIEIDNLFVNLEFTQFKHLGIFPEQHSNWKIIQKEIKQETNFLNLFAYTGLASLFACENGANVKHVDSVKHLISWAKSNMESSNLSNINWVLEDALKFAAKEQKRGKKYQGIIMDPPAFGLGTKGEKWILDQKIEELLKVGNDLLEEDGFLILNTYSPKINAVYLLNLAKSCFQNKSVIVKELWMKTTSKKDLYFGNVLYVNLKM